MMSCTDSEIYEKALLKSANHLLGESEYLVDMRTSSLKTVPAKMRVLWQNSREEAIADEEVEAHGGADRFCPVVSKTSPRVTAMSQILRKRA